ncbi:MAG: methanogen output domain 1-containing protein [Methanobacterium sp.]|uniref:methanogen output domain 1-containing protein n=1 Tax=Methanobacterium sp. TaxID=2164 RepID=UPI003C70E909
MANERIMIVEDESIVAMGIKHKLEDLGYKIVGIESTGEGAVDTALKAEPDLILMDIVLKGDMDGIEAAQMIHGHLDTPIIYITAYSDEEVLRRARITEPYGYILKPFKKSEVNANIQMAIYKHACDKKKSEILKKRILADFYDFILTAMPTSSTGTNIEMKQLLLKVFSDRLDEDMYPKFVEELRPDEIEDNETLFMEYVKWITDIFKDFGIKTILTHEDDKISLEFLNCPWLDDAKTKPVFCLNCQAMMNRSYNWTGLSGGMEKKSSMTEGHPSCKFYFKRS